MPLTQKQIKSLESAISEKERYPEYAHKVTWAIRDIIYDELLNYGKAWEITSGPISDCGGDPMESAEEIVASAELTLVSKIVDIIESRNR